jgi:phosphate transport system substrate-binding protein
MKKIITLVFSVFFVCSLFGASYAGDLRIDGSTTVLPIVQRGAEVFMKKDPGAKVFISGSGSGMGIKALIDGTTHIATSSREAKGKEVASAKGKGVTLTVHKVALDGIVPVVHPSMKIKDITTEQLRDIYNGKITNWKDLGGPNRPISTVSRDTSSGTYEVWEEKILKGDKVKPDALLVASNGQAVQTVSQNRFAIGYIGIGYIDKSVKALTVNGKSASANTVRDGSWPIARPLFMYTNGKPAGVIAKFIDFMLSKDGQKIVNEIKYVSIK